MPQPLVVEISETEEEQWMEALGHPSAVTSQTSVAPGIIKYSEDQPRVPAGSSEGGEFAPSGGGTGPSAPRDRRTGEPPTRPWQDPPPPQGRAGGRAGGYSSTGRTNTEIGDLGEAATTQLGMRSLLPPGDRRNPLDLEFDHTGWAFELKVVTTKAAEYKMKPKAAEVKSKLRYARKYGLRPASMIGVMDLQAKTMHVYWREGIGAFRLQQQGWNFLGRVKVRG